ncbi:hypothetical protein FNF27_02179 [Cafeteria roenbergensis]|uniref:Uncharacterized protein n=1 Tax=Cafeteria roenbergensis TaxID=33653 RepID=A0A5A8EF28_CAFRO|nr:hypothetical protein FNF27_02179 [Cafeteria roenbergensis]
MAQVRMTADALRASLSLPKSALPMRANAATREALAQVRVSRDGYVRQLEARKGRPTFVLHDGPPYANGNAHMGHLLNKTIKDAINRHAMLRGKRVVYIPGWDCHGLPIEHKALQSVDDPDAARMRPWVVRPQARSVALGALADQARDCERWGVAADWAAVGAAAADPAAGGAEGASAGAATRGVWPGSYRTLDPAYEGMQLRLLRSLIARGLVFRGLRPVHWSPSSLTAVAEAELEYADDHVSTAAWVRFDLASLDHADAASLPPQLAETLAASANGGSAGVSLAAWTTTPWTLPANEALCVHPRLRYVAAAVEADEGPLPRGHLLVVAETRLAEVEEALWPGADAEAPDGADSGAPAGAAARPRRLRVVGSPFDGAALVGARCRHPLAEADPDTYGPAARLPPVLAGGHVTDESGSGVVHTAPGHGAEDWQCVLESASPQLSGAAAAVEGGAEGAVGAAWLPADAARAGAVRAMAAELVGLGPSGAVNRVRCPVDAAGRFTAEAGWDLEGVDATTAGSQRVLEGLSSASCLLASAEHRHRYPIDWRTKQPIMTRATWQWFASAEALHEAACAALDDVTMVPPAGRARLEAAVRGRKAWCISRQRSWGVPIPVHYAGGDGSAGEGSPELGDDVLAAAEELVTRCGAGAWWTAAADGALPAAREDLRAMAREGALERGRDTLDVWFDSGASWLAAWAGREGSEAELGRGDDAARALPVAEPGAAAGGSPLQGIRADVVFEGSDQHRGWFQSSLLTAVAAAPEGSAPRAPFGAVVTHGFVLDAEGRKMSKSLGNVVAPAELIEARDGAPAGGQAAGAAGTPAKGTASNGKPAKGKPAKSKPAKGKGRGRPAALDGGLGADVVRQWAAATDYTTDVVLAEQPLASAADGVRRIRNVSRFLLGAVTPRAVRLWEGDGAWSELAARLADDHSGVDATAPLIEAWAAAAPSADSLLQLEPGAAARAPAGPLERLVLHRLRRTAEAADDAIGSRFSTARAVAELQSFLSNDVSALLVDASKDALYAGLPAQWRRASAQAAAWHVLRGVALLTSPITPFLADEVFQASALPVLCRGEAPELGGRDLARDPLAPGATLVDAITAMGPSGWEVAVPSCWRDDSLEAENRFGGVELLRSLASHAREEARRAGAVRSDLETAATVVVEEGSPLAEAARWMAGQGAFTSGAQLAEAGGFDPAAYPGLEPLCDVLRVSEATIAEVPSGTVAAAARELGGFVAHIATDTARHAGQAAVVVAAAPGRNWGARRLGQPVKDVVRLLLAKGADPEAGSEESWPPLHCAAFHGHVDVVRLLLDHGADILSYDKFDNPVLCLPARAGRAEVVQLLVDRGADPFATSHDGWNYVVDVARNGEVETCERLLNRIADPVEYGENCQAALAASSRAHRWEVVEMLLGRGIKVGHEFPAGNHALRYAACQGRRDDVKLLLDLGAEPTLADEDGNTALLLASRNGHLETVRLLLDRGGAVDSKDKRGNTALLRALSSRRPHVARLLVERGANVHAKNARGQSPLFLAAWFGDVESLRLLLLRSADVNVKCNLGITPLHAAVFHGFEEAIELLLYHGADVGAKSARGLTPADKTTNPNHLRLLADPERFLRWYRRGNLAMWWVAG